MGQQQLLLLVLGVVVVGLAVAVVVGMVNAYEARSYASLMTQAAGQIASDARLWATMPADMGGGNRGPGAEDYDGLTWGEIGRSASESGYYQDPVAFYDLRPSGRTLVVEACAPNRGVRVVLTARLTQQGQRTEVDVDTDSGCTRPGGSGTDPVSSGQPEE